MRGRLSDWYRRRCTSLFTIQTFITLTNWNSCWFSSGAVLTRTLSIQLLSNGVKCVKLMFVSSRDNDMFCRAKAATTLRLASLRLSLWQPARAAGAEPDSLAGWPVAQCIDFRLSRDCNVGVKGRSYSSSVYRAKGRTSGVSPTSVASATGEPNYGYRKSVSGRNSK